MKMEEIKEKIFKFLKIDNLVNHLSAYIDTRVQLFKIEIKEDIAKVLSKGLVHGTIALVAFLFLLFLSFGLAQFLNDQLENSYGGYLIVAGFYFLIIVVLLVFRKSIDQKFGKYFSELINQAKD